jgi:subtilisin family serine protease
MTPFRTLRLALLGTLLAASLNAAAASGGEEVPGELLVKLRSGDSLQPTLLRYNLTLVSRFGSRPIFRMKVTGNASAQGVVAQMATDPAVLIAETHVGARSPEARQNMPWAIGNPTAYVNQWFPNPMRLPAALALSQGAGVRVAVLDTGVDLTHPLLAGHLIPGRDFVDDDNDPSEVGSTSNSGYGHGTHVAGLVALTAPAARIMPLRVLDVDGVGNAWVLSEAMLYAADPDGNPATDDGVHVMNLSLGSLSRTRVMAAISQIVACEPEVPDDPIGDRSDPGYADDHARCLANGHGAVIIAAAGNDGSQSLRQYPAAESAYGLVPVGAYTSRRRMASFSNSGSWVSIAAPGEGITSTVPGGGVGTWSGTSMAAPLASGVAALLRAYQPALTPKEVGRRMERTGAPVCGIRSIMGLDAYAVLRDLRSDTPPCR